MDMSDSESDGGGGPPPPAAGTSQSASTLRQSGLWGRAAGRGGPSVGRGRGKPASESGDGPRFERISLWDLELEGTACPDGGSSEILSAAGEDEDGYADDEPLQKNGKGKGKARADAPPNAADLLAAAAFGAHREQDLFSEDDSMSQASMASSKRKREAEKQAFPVKGVTCVGCVLSNRTMPVERFVEANLGRMSDHALWKMAALIWQREVIEPAAKEGAIVVPWAWKSIAAHFKLHTSDSKVARLGTIQTLTAMRLKLEQSLMRVDGDQRTLDKQAAELMLKLVSAESKERQLLCPPVRGEGSSR